MLKRTVKTIHNLKVFFFAVIIVSFFFYLGVNPISWGHFMGARFGDAVGMEVSIPENPFNKLAAQLEAKEERLDARERELDKRAEALALEDPATDSPVVIGLALGIVFLFVLLVLNYYLDWKRRRQDQAYLRNYGQITRKNS
jgi:hypothetical protein